MDTAMPKQQRGLSLEGFIFWAFLFVIASIFGIRLIPAYIQYGEIKNVFAAISQDPDMQKASQGAIRLAFARRASIDDIKAIKADEIDISTDEDKLVLSASYSVKIPMAGNVSILLDFNPTSAK